MREPPPRAWGLPQEKMSDSIGNYRAIRRVLLITMGLNALATAIKIVVAWRTGSLSVMADGLDTLFDAASNIVGLVGISLAFRPPDEEHPYGHRKFEAVAALVIAYFLFLTAWEVAKSAMERLSTHVAPTIVPWNVIALLVSIAFQALTAAYEARRGRALQSEVLVADARHTWANVAVSFSVLGGMGLVRLGYPVADPLLALVIAGLIVKIGIDILRENVPTLTDRAPVPPERIRAVAEAVPGVEYVHAIRSRGPADAASVDLHIHVPRRMALAEADRVGDEVRKRLLTQVEGVQDVVVHVEPRPLSHITQEDIFAVLREIASDLSLTIHESAAHQVDGRLYVEVDIGVPRDLTLAQAHELVSKLEAEAHARLPQLADLYTHIESANAEIGEGRAVEPDLRRRILEEVARLPGEMDGLQDVHHVRVREGDRGRVFVMLHGTVNPSLSVLEAHDVAEGVEARLKARLPEITHVVVHTEPPEGDLP